MSGRIIAFDLGEKRIGVAVSDPSGTIAEGREPIFRSGSSVPWRLVVERVNESGAVQAVVGDPLMMDGSLGPGSHAARDFAEQLTKRTGLPVQLEDERCTSVMAEQVLRETARGRSAKKKRESRQRGETDTVAAVIILQSFLDGRGEAAARAARAASRDGAPGAGPGAEPEEPGGG